jgi:hypothetical protein
MSIIRRARAIAVLALVWGGLYAVAGGIFYLLESYWSASPNLIEVLREGRWFAFRWAVLGTISGGVFGAVVNWSERHHTFAELRLRRMTLLGAVAGAALPLLHSLPVLMGVSDQVVGTGTLAALTTFGGLLGAACGAVCLSLGRSVSAATDQPATLYGGSPAKAFPGEAPAELKWQSGAKTGAPRIRS